MSVRKVSTRLSEISMSEKALRHCRPLAISHKAVLSLIYARLDWSPIGIAGQGVYQTHVKAGILHQAHQNVQMLESPIQHMRSVSRFAHITESCQQAIGSLAPHISVINMHWDLKQGLSDELLS